MTTPGNITQLLLAWNGGDAAALEHLISLVQEDLRKLAKSHLRRERPNHTLQTTALVNEVYLRLIDQTRVSWQNRAHFFGVVALSMRRILVDYAKGRKRLKRGGGAEAIELSDHEIISAERQTDLIDLDEALSRLVTLDQRKSQIIELRYFVGMELSEIAEMLHISERTVARDWHLARAWLKRELDTSHRSH